MSAKMEHLFRLSVLRPAPQVADPSKPVIHLAQSTALQRELADLDGNLDQITNSCQRYAKNNQFLRKVDDHGYALHLEALTKSLDNMIQQGQASHSTLTSAIDDAFASDRAKLDDGELKDTISRLKDTILVIKRLPEEQWLPVVTFTVQLKLLCLIVQAKMDLTFPKSIGELQQYRDQVLVLPSTLEIKSLREKMRQDLEHQRGLAKLRNSEKMSNAVSLFNTLQATDRAVAELLSIDQSHWTLPPDASEVIPVNPPDELRPAAIDLRHSKLVDQLADMNRRYFDLALSMGDRGQTVEPTRVLDSSGSVSALKIAERLLDETKNLPRQYPKSTIPVQQPISLGLEKSALDSLSEGARSVLAKHNIDLLVAPLDQTVSIVRSKSVAAAQELKTLYSVQDFRSRKVRMGDQVVTIKQQIPPLWVKYGTLDPSKILPPESNESEPDVSSGTVQLAGTMDLYVVKQHLLKYEGGDIAHIENILKGESKTIETVEKTRTEQIIFQETETTTTTEKSTEGTDRYEMQNETTNTIQEQTQLSGTVTLSGSYGPMVNFSATASGSTSKATQGASKTASNFSKEITQKSSEKITKRVLQRTTQTITKEITLTNSHEIKNTETGAKHVAGVYQWQNKVYRAQLWKYDKPRTLYDFMIPEPAAPLIRAMDMAYEDGITLERPPQVDFTANSLKEYTYQDAMRLFGAVGGDPYPAQVKYIFAPDTKGSFKPGEGASDTKMLVVPDGYTADWGVVSLCQGPGQRVVFECQVGAKFLSFAFAPLSMQDMFSPGLMSKPFQIKGAASQIPLYYSIYKEKNDGFTTSYAIGCAIRCTLNKDGISKWQWSIYNLILNAQKAQQVEYETKLTALKNQAGLIAIKGTNPDDNLRTMAEEIKKQCISIFRRKGFSSQAIRDPAFSDTTVSPFDPDSWAMLPEIDFSAAEKEGPVVRFFEQAFDWDNMQWVTYPYFWGRKSQWATKLAYNDPDPVFNKFLKAGYCRVSVPVRLGFETAVQHYVDMLDYWRGGELPDISSAPYVSVAQEVAEQAGRPDDGVTLVDQWEVLVPTNLVKLRPNDDTPAWDFTGDIGETPRDGKWVETN